LQDKNYFELFGLPSVFSIDAHQLQQTYRALQRQFHPDRFVNASAQEQRIALQYATTINEAYQQLKTPLPRAQYLLQLAGLQQGDHTMRQDPIFLFQQMEWREALSAAKNKAELIDLLQNTRLSAGAYEAEFSQLYEQENYTEAQHVLDKLQFVTKFEKELQAKAASFPE
jgi:molecular chaperone HscB